jgi:hypothetical protein
MPMKALSGGAQCSKLHTDDYAVPVSAAQRLPDQQLIVPHAVVIAGVEQVDPGVEGRVDRGDALWLLRRTIDTGHAHAAQPNRRDERTGRPQLSRDHQKAPVLRSSWPTYPTDLSYRLLTSVSPRDTAVKRQEETGDADDGDAEESGGIAPSRRKACGTE